MERRTDGPLSDDDIVGGVSVLAPDDVPWRASFGSLLLCSTDGSRAVLEQVRVEGDPAPLSVRAYAHRQREGTDGQTDLFSSSRGSAPDWEEPYADVPPERARRAEAYTELADTVIDEPCPARLPSDGYTDLVVVMEADERGVEVPAIEVDYRVGDQPYTLRIDRQLLMCGTEVRTGC